METRKIFKRDLFLVSLVVTCLFAILLLGLQYLAFVKVAADKEKRAGRSRITQEEISLYKANTRNLADLFHKELEAMENESSSVNARIAKNYIGSRIRPVQTYFNEYVKKRPHVRNVFLLNKFGRLLAFTPYREEEHNDIFDYAQYYKHLRIQLAQSKRNAATYFYLFDPEIINRGITNSSLAQPPFFSMSQAAQVPRGLVTKGLVNFDESASDDNLGKMPYVITASPFFYDGGYWGMSGLVVPLSYYLNSVKGNMPSQLLHLIIMSHDGHIVYSPDAGMIGLSASEDIVFKELQASLKKSGSNGFFYHNAGPVFYSQTDKFVFLSFPVKYLGGIRDKSFFSTVIPAYVYLLLFLELVLIAFLFLLYYRKIIQGLQGLLSKYSGDLVFPALNDELDAMDYMIASFSQQMGLSAESLASSDILTPSDPFAARITNKGFFDKGGDELKKIMDSSSSDIGSAVYVSLHNAATALEDSNAGMGLLNTLAPIVYRLAEQNDGFITNSSMTSFTVCFGIPFKESDHLRKSWQFIKSLLTEVKAIPGGNVSIGCAAETGTLIYGGMKYNGQEEFVVTGPVMDFLQKVESVSGDNVAIIGETYVKSNIVERSFVKEEVTLKIRDQKTNVSMFVVKIS